MAIRVVIADDHTVIRAGIRAMLERIAGIEIFGEASTGRETLALVERHQPHLLTLTDIGMPDINWLELTARVTTNFPNARVLIISMYATDEYMPHVLRAGAAGFLLKDTDANELELAVQSVMAGKSYPPSDASQRVAKKALRRSASSNIAETILTPRQREILQLIVEGKSTKEIAQMLILGPKTVETHRTRLMERLQICDVPSLVQYAMRMGVVPPQ